MKIEKDLYELTLSQEVVRMELMFSFDKRVVNIVSSATCDEEINQDLMKQAINLAIKRNDCTHIRFIKKNKKLLQYFDDSVQSIVVPSFNFNSKEEQEKFIEKQTKKPIAYRKGKVIEISLVKTYNNKDMVFIKVCHYIMDTYGIIMFLKDIFDVYNSLKNGEELPPELKKFEDIVKKDVVRKNDKEFSRKNAEFFTDYYKDKPEPYYAGVPGLTTKRARRRFEKRTMDMFLVNNQTKGYMKEVGTELTTKIMSYCMEHKVTPANLLFFASSVCQSKMNNNIQNMLQLELCNCRATALERGCSGTKVQSLGCYIHLEHDKSISENFKIFCDNQNIFYRHLGYSDFEFQALTHKTWKSSPIKTYYPISFSFVPMAQPKGVEFQVYSNGKFALPCYFGILYDTVTNTMRVVYDAQVNLMEQKHIDLFQENFEAVVTQIIENDTQTLKDIKIKLGE